MYLFLLRLIPLEDCENFTFIELLTQQATIDEYSTRVGQQAVVVVATPSKSGNNFKCFGAKPLEDVVSLFLKAILVHEFIITSFKTYNVHIVHLPEIFVYKFRISKISKVCIVEEILTTS